MSVPGADLTGVAPDHHGPGDHGPGGQSGPSGDRDLGVSLLAHLAAGGPLDAADGVDLTCRAHPDPSATSGRVRLPGCLAELERHVPVEVLAAGACRVVLHVPSCPDRDGLVARFAQVSAVLPGRLVVDAVGQDTGENQPTGRERVADASGGPVPGERRSSPAGRDRAAPSQEGPAVSRRSLFGLHRRDEVVVANLPPFRPDPAATSHTRLLTALAVLLPDGPEATGPQAAGPAPGVLLHAGPGTSGAGCTACQVCVRVCPEDALQLAVTADLATLSQVPSRCSGCRQCLVACPEAVLTVQRPLTWAEQLGPDDATPLATRHTAVCRRCGTRFPSTQGDLCDVCRYRTANPFGSHLPDHVQALLRSRQG